MESLARIPPLCHCAFNAFLVSERVPRLESRACQTSGPRAAAAVVNNRGSRSSKDRRLAESNWPQWPLALCDKSLQSFSSVAVDLPLCCFLSAAHFSACFRRDGVKVERLACFFFRRPWLAKFQASGLSDQLLLCWSRRSPASKLLYARGVDPGPELLLLTAAAAAAAVSAETVDPLRRLMATRRG